MKFRSFLLVLFLATVASAATITVTSAVGEWQNPTPVAGITIDNTPPTIRVSWGTPLPGDDQSAYEFTPSIPPPVMQAINPPPVTP